jgi:hypothetical protein
MVGSIYQRGHGLVAREVITIGVREVVVGVPCPGEHRQGGEPWENAARLPTHSGKAGP